MFFMTFALKAKKEVGIQRRRKGQSRKNDHDQSLRSGGGGGPSSARVQIWPLLYQQDPVVGVR